MSGGVPLESGRIEVSREEFINTMRDEMGETFEVNEKAILNHLRGRGSFVEFKNKIYRME